MNPQIKTILDKATDETFQVDQERFARLLIEECANICYELKFTDEGPSDGAAYQRSLCGTSIRENFGLISKGPITAKNIK